MAFRVSPGVSIKEIDLTTIVPAVATTPGGFAGYFHWGPTDEIVTVTSATELASIFGKPYNDNYIDFYTPANFLSYGNNMQVVRVVGATASNGTVTGTGGHRNLTIKNTTDFESIAAVTTAATNGVLFAAKYPGALGSSIKVVVTNGSGITGASLAEAATQGETFIDVTTTGQSQVRYFAVND